MEFRVQGSGLKDWGSGFRVEGSGFRVQGSGFRVQGSGFRVQGSGFRVQGSGFRVQGLAGARARGGGIPRVKETPHRVWGVWDVWCRVQCVGCRVKGVGCSVHGVGGIPRARDAWVSTNPESIRNHGTHVNLRQGPEFRVWSLRCRV